MARKAKRDGPIKFAGHCQQCDRTVAQCFPPRSTFIQTSEVWVRCCQCKRPVYVTKQHASN